MKTLASGKQKAAAVEHYDLPDGCHASGFCRWCGKNHINDQLTVLCNHGFCPDCFLKAEANYHSLIRVRETWWAGVVEQEVENPYWLAVRDARSLMETGQLPVESPPDVPAELPPVAASAKWVWECKALMNKQTTSGADTGKWTMQPCGWKAKRAEEVPITGRCPQCGELLAEA